MLKIENSSSYVKAFISFKKVFQIVHTIGSLCCKASRCEVCHACVFLQVAHSFMLRSSAWLWKKAILTHKQVNLPESMAGLYDDGKQNSLQKPHSISVKWISNCKNLSLHSNFSMHTVLSCDYRQSPLETKLHPDFPLCRGTHR